MIFLRRQRERVASGPLTPEALAALSAGRPFLGHFLCLRFLCGESMLDAALIAKDATDAGAPAPTATEMRYIAERWRR